MAQKGLAVNQLKTPPGRFTSQGLQTLTTGNTDLRDKSKVNNQSKSAGRQAERGSQEAGLREPTCELFKRDGAQPRVKPYGGTFCSF